MRFRIQGTLLKMTRAIRQQHLQLRIQLESVSTLKICQLYQSIQVFQIDQSKLQTFIASNLSHSQIYLLLFSTLLQFPVHKVQNIKTKACCHSQIF